MLVANDRVELDGVACTEFRHLLGRVGRRLRTRNGIDPRVAVEGRAHAVDEAVREVRQGHRAARRRRDRRRAWSARLEASRSRLGHGAARTQRQKQRDRQPPHEERNAPDRQKATAARTWGPTRWGRRVPSAFVPGAPPDRRPLTGRVPLRRSTLLRVHSARSRDAKRTPANHTGRRPRAGGERLHRRRDHLVKARFQAVLAGPAKPRPGNCVPFRPRPPEQAVSCLPRRCRSGSEAGSG